MNPRGTKGTATCRVFLLAGLLLGQATTATGETLSLKHLFTVQEAARDESLERPASIAVDTLRGEVYLSDRMRKEILIYDEEGRFLQRIGKSSGIQIPFHIAVSPPGILVVGEQDLPELAVIEMGETRPLKIDLKTDLSPPLLSGGITVRSDGEIFVVERFGKSVFRIDRNAGSVDRFFSGTLPSSGECAFQDVTTTRDDRVIVLSSKGHAIHVLDKNGKELKRFGFHGSRPENFSFPTAVTLGPKGTIWIVDSFQHSIKVFDPDGSFLGEFGEMGTDEGKFFFPIDIAFGKGKRLVVLEKGVPRFQAFQLVDSNESENR